MLEGDEEDKRDTPVDVVSVPSVRLASGANILSPIRT